MNLNQVLKLSAKPLPQPIPSIPSLVSLCLDAWILSLPDNISNKDEEPMQPTPPSKKRTKSSITKQPSTPSPENAYQRIFEALPSELIDLLLQIFEEGTIRRENNPNLYVNTQLLSNKIQQYYLLLKVQQFKRLAAISSHNNNQNTSNKNINNNNNNNIPSDQEGRSRLCLNFSHFIKNSQYVYNIRSVFNDINLISNYLQELVVDTSIIQSIGKENCEVILYRAPLRKLVIYSGKREPEYLIDNLSISNQPIDPSCNHPSGYKGADDIIGISTLLGKSIPWYIEGNNDKDEEEQEGDDNFGQKKNEEAE